MMLHDILVNGLPYEELYFVLAEDEESFAAIVGHTHSDEPAVGNLLWPASRSLHGTRASAARPTFEIYDFLETIGPNFVLSNSLGSHLGYRSAAARDLRLCACQINLRSYSPCPPHWYTND